MFTYTGSADVERQLDFLDETTQSILLVSTRLRGLVQGANEIQLGLLSSQEAVEMLCKMASLQIESGIPPEVLPIVNLCGR